MINLLKLVTEKIKEVHQNAYLEHVPEVDPISLLPVEFPYIVYRMPTSNTDEAREDFILELDVWDKNTDSTVLESLTEALNSKFHKNRFVGVDFYCRFERINRMMILDSDPQIKRRQLRFQVKVYFE